MPWIIAMKLFGFGKTLLSWGRSALRWIVSDWRHILIALVSLFAAYQWLEAGKYQRAHERAVTSLERANKTIADMKAASEAAKQAAIANAKRVEADYERIADNAEIAYKNSLTGNRAALDRWLRKDGNRATSQANCPAVSEMPGEPVQDAGKALVPIRDLEIAADNYSQLTALIEWARGVQDVRTVPNSGTPLE